MFKSPCCDNADNTAMRIQQQLFDLIQSVTGRRQLLTVPRPLAAFMGSLEGGLFLSQLLYWSDRSTTPDGRHGWFYKSFADWEDETLLSRYKVEKYTRACQERGILEIDVRPTHNAAVTHYRLRLDRLQQQLLAFLRDGALPESADPSCKNSQEGVPKSHKTSCENSQEDPPKIRKTPCKNSQDPPQKFTRPLAKIRKTSLTETTTKTTSESKTQTTTKTPNRPLPFRAADWQDVLAELRNQLPAATFEHALQRCRFLRRDGDLLLLAARNPYAADAINHRLRPVVERTLNAWLRAGGLTGRPLHIRALPPSVSRKLIPAERPPS